MVIPPLGMGEECHGLTQGYQGGWGASTTGYQVMHMHRWGEINRNHP